MIPTGSLTQGAVKNLSRVCGGDPNIKAKLILRGGFVPRMRG